MGKLFSKGKKFAIKEDNSLATKWTIIIVNFVVFITNRKLIFLKNVKAEVKDFIARLVLIKLRNSSSYNLGGQARVSLLTRTS